MNIDELMKFIEQSLEAIKATNKDEIIMSKEAYYDALNAAQESGQRMGYAQGRDETVRKILQKTQDYIENSVGGYLLIDRKGIRELATELGIDLEG